MSHLSMLRALWALAALVCTGSAFTMMGGASPLVGRFDFGYDIQGQGVARPLQVFDDGESRTYFQFHEDDPTPVVLELDGRKVLVPEREGPFTVVPSLAREFTLVMGESRAQVRHARHPGLPPQPQPPLRLAALGGRALASSAASKIESGSYAIPLQGDVLEWRAAGRAIEQPVLFPEGASILSKDVERALLALAAQIGAEARVVVIGREDRSLKDGLAERRAQRLRDTLMRAGLASAQIQLQIGAEQGEPVLQGRQRWVASTIRWTPSVAPVRSEPMTVAPDADPAQDMLERSLAEFVRVGKLSAEGAERIKSERRARTAQPHDPSVRRLFELRVADGTVGEALARWARGSGYELVWDAPRAPLTGSAQIEARDFLDAVRTVVAGLRQQGYPVKAKAFADGVLQVRTEP